MLFQYTTIWEGVEAGFLSLLNSQRQHKDQYINTSQFGQFHSMNESSLENKIKKS